MENIYPSHWKIFMGQNNSSFYVDQIFHPLFYSIYWRCCKEEGEFISRKKKILNSPNSNAWNLLSKNIWLECIFQIAKDIMLCYLFKSWHNVLNYRMQIYNLHYFQVDTCLKEKIEKICINYKLKIQNSDELKLSFN